MGLKDIIERIENFLGKGKRERRKKAAKLEALIEQLENKRKKLKRKLADASSKQQKRKLESRLRSTTRHLEKGRAELEKLK